MKHKKQKTIWKIRKRYTNLEIVGKYALANGMLEMPGAIREIVVGLPCGAVAGITSSSLQTQVHNKLVLCLKYTSVVKRSF